MVNVKRFKPFVVPIGLLIITDQTVKIIISKFFMQCEFEILTGLLQFKPTQNTNLTWIGNFVGGFSNILIAVLLNLLAIFLIISGYLLYSGKVERTKLPVKIIVVCGLAGCFCSLLDKLVWGGSLDFLQIPNLFIFDIKDCYLTLSEVVFVGVGILHSKEISVKEYLRFCLNKFNR